MFGRRGASVMLMDLDVEAGNALCAELRGEGIRCEFAAGDVSKPDDCRKVVAETVKRLGGLDVLVNNAGGGRLFPTEQLSDEEWRHVQGINIDGTFYMSREALRVMGAQSRGAIVNLSSIYGVGGYPNHVAYVSAKGAIMSLTKALAIEYAPKNVRVNAVAPGVILTPLITRSLDEAAQRYFTELHPLRRMGQPDEVANVICFLASDEASFVTGVTLPVDGGYTAQ